MTASLAIISGEMSGDLVGGALAAEIRKRRPDLALWGIGSRHMEAAGVELLYNSGEWSAIGVVEALKLYPRLRFGAYPAVLREIGLRRPAAVVLIDFGAFNSKVARWCRAQNVRVMWYFPPGSWRRTGRVNPEIARVADRVATPFPWSEQRLRDIGAQAEFVGHPLADLVQPSCTREQFAARFGMDPGSPIIGLLPGSRGFEITYNTPTMLEAAEIVYRELPESQFVVGAASPVARERIEQILIARQERLARAAEEDRTESGNTDPTGRAEEREARMVTSEGIVVPGAAVRDRDAAFRRRLTEASRRKNLLPVVIVEDLTYDVMAHADALLVCSGTATLEAALLNTPMVILYRGSRLMALEARVRRIRPEHIGLPNIIAGRRIVPEMVQEEATPGALAEALLRVLTDPEARSRVRQDLAAVRADLLRGRGPGQTASARAAEMAIELAGV